MKTALFGGTFDPVHLGHLLMAEAARERFGLDRVVFVTAGLPPHKKKPSTPPEHRLRMVRLAVRSNPFFSVSDWEIRQRRVVYTYETLAHFRASYPRDRLFFLVGSDSLRDLPMWRRGPSLLKECRFLVVERPETPWTSLPASLRRQARLVPSFPVPFSSHQIRRRVFLRRSIRYQVPEAVDRYIAARRLYRAKTSA